MILLLADLALAKKKPAEPPPPPPAPPAAPEMPFIPLETLLGNPEKVSPQISPDATMLAYIAPRDGVLNLWVRTVGQADDRPVTQDTGRGIRQYFWAPDGKQLLYLQDAGGDENWQLFSVPAAGGTPKELTPAKARVEPVAVEPGHPEAVLMGVNDRDPALFDVYRVDPTSGKRELVVKNEMGATQWVADHALRTRAAVVMTPDGGAVVKHRADLKSKWTDLVTIPVSDALGAGPLGFAGDDQHLYMIDSTGANTSELRSVDVKTGKATTLVADPGADVSAVLVDPTTHAVQAVAFEKDRLEWKIVDPAVQADFDGLAKLARGDVSVISQDDTNRHWVVAFASDTASTAFYHWDRTTHTGTKLFSARPALDTQPLTEMKPVQWMSRDGQTLVHGYLTVPSGKDPRNLPTVINVHGGPWARDSWGFDPEAQWLANRGYAVLQPNYRGSTGYGKAHLNAGDREWGGKMQDDISDGVKWLVDQGIADPRRVAIFGGSYGGYATLAGLAYTPDLYACGVDIVGPSNLMTFMETIPPYWGPFIPILYKRVGNPTTEPDFLKSRSPLFSVDKIVDPLLIAQGANDPRVNKAESLQMVEALQKAGKTVKYVEFSDEGHGFARPENRLYFYREAEKFLGTCLGGRVAEDAKNPTAPGSVIVR